MTLFVSLAAGGDAQNFDAIVRRYYLNRPFASMQRRPVMFDERCLGLQLVIPNQVLDGASVAAIDPLAIDENSH
jgi:hypothetical protein